uniref:Uncharacterized protein n=1 Tax=Timema genevievae TaxID=629358 RepID=A0A7R9KAF7_TIMGE|nr:unnamed protein product [Timema genevievae]
MLHDLDRLIMNKGPLPLKEDYDIGEMSVSEMSTLRSERRVRSQERSCWFTTEVTLRRIPSVSSLMVAISEQTNSRTSPYNGSAGRPTNAVSLFFMRVTAVRNMCRGDV